MKEKLKKKMRKVANIATLISLIFNVGAFTAFIPKASAMTVVDPVSPGDVVINEVMPTGSEEWVELYNTTSEPIDLTGWLLRDFADNNVATLSGTIGANGFLVFSANYLNDDGDTVYLYDNSSEPIEIDSRSYDTAVASEAYAAKPDGSTKVSDWYWTSALTPNESNVLSAPALMDPKDGDHVNGATVTMDWSDVDGAAQYQYQSCWDSSCTNVKWSGAYNVSTKTATNVPEGTFYWRVRAIDDDGINGAWSSINEVTIDNTPPTLDFVNISSSNTNSDSLAKVNDVITLSLTSSEDITKPVVIIAGKIANVSGSGKDWTAEYTMNEFDSEVSSIMFNISGYQDLAENLGDAVSGTSDGSNVAFDKTGPKDPTKSKIEASNPTNFNNPIVDGTFFNSKIGEAFSGQGEIGSSYEVRKIEVVFENNNDKTQYIKTVIPTEDDYFSGNYSTEKSGDFTVQGTAKNLEDGIYAVTVKEYDEAGNFKTEDVDAAFAVDTVKPGQVQNLTITAKTADSASLKWDAATDNVGGTGVAGYRVYYGTVETGYTGVRDAGNVTEATITGLNASTQYYFYVVSYDKAQNQSVASNEVSDKTYDKPVQVASTSSAPPAGVVESAQAQNPQETQNQDQNKDEKKDENKGGMSWIWFLIIAMLAGGGYYYYVTNPAFFSNLFKSGPKPPLS